MAQQQRQHGTTTGSAVRERTASPHSYRVVFHNDDVTTMEFVVMVLMTVFEKPRALALSLMLKVHYEGQAEVCRDLSYDMAMTKTREAITMARSHGYPLNITVEQQ